VHLAVERAFLDQELRPLEIAVAGEKRFVQIKSCESHGLRAGAYCGSDIT
jgi:hypothetical protein